MTLIILKKLILSRIFSFKWLNLKFENFNAATFFWTFSKIYWKCPGRQFSKISFRKFHSTPSFGIRTYYWCNSVTKCWTLISTQLLLLDWLRYINWTSPCSLQTISNLWTTESDCEKDTSKDSISKEEGVWGTPTNVKSAL